ncbi:MAG: SIMPL domain-containing protein [Flavobacterium sp.]|uniref:SIMPL domain-containing protein n=1 Tax=Flavobacterium sp. TaxID=239 RepID=UPI0022C7FAFC|nr:SIMPL domain-containing protein [Flavobacterium sp.]MCZ8196487.1 SIMPL domain-containing protein [Flavobacterium sp.]
MKKSILILITFFTIMMDAQEYKPQIPQVTVSGEGKIKVTPDQALLTVSIETKGTKAADVKKENDIAVEKVLQFVKRMKLPKEDVLTQRVNLYPNYDYEKKKHNYLANQTIVILLKDLSKYDELSEGLIDNGVNRIENVEFKSSKLEQLQSDARKAAMKDAKQKAEDYVSVLNQKIGKALLINDNSQAYYPQPIYKGAMMAMADGSEAPRETLAIGEIEVIANVTVSFLLD